jgi:hypothetical protein
MGKIVVLIVVLIICAVGYYLYINKGKPEVYLITSPDGSYKTSFKDALNVARTFDSNATIATSEQIAEAYSLGAQWCSTGWDSGGLRKFPMQVVAPGCGDVAGVQLWGPPDLVANVTVYGVKPTQKQVEESETKLKVLPFYLPATSITDPKPMKWSRWDP